MNRRIQLMYLSMCIVVMAQRINGNLMRMDQLLKGGEALSSARLVKLDMANQRLGCRMHDILQCALTLRAAVTKSERIKVIFSSKRELGSRWALACKAIKKRSEIVWSFLNRFGWKRRSAERDSAKKQDEKFSA